jgi:hypothetical protein
MFFIRAKLFGMCEDGSNLFSDVNKCSVPQVIYKTRFCFRCQENTEDRAQKTDDRRQGANCFSVFCHLTSVLCYLTPET